MDRAIFYWINGWPEWLNPLFQFFSEGFKGIYLRITLVALLIVMVRWQRTRIAAITAVIAWPLANELADVLKAALLLQRPNVNLSDAILRVDKLTSPGMPSAHAATMMSIAVCFFLGGPRPLAYGWLVVAILTGLSRIYVGVHFPSQVLAGWAVGALVGFAVYRLIGKYLEHRRRLRKVSAEASAAP